MKIETLTQVQYDTFSVKNIKFHNVAEINKNKCSSRSSNNSKDTQSDKNNISTDKKSNSMS